MNQALQLSSLILYCVVVCGLCVCVFFFLGFFASCVVCGLWCSLGLWAWMWFRVCLVALHLFVVCGLCFFLGLLAGRSGVPPRVPEKTTNHKPRTSPGSGKSHKPQTTNKPRVQEKTQITNHKPQTSPESPNIDFLKDLVGGSFREIYLTKVTCQRDLLSKRSIL